MANAVVQPFAVVVESVYTSVADATVLGLGGDMGVTHGADQGVGTKVKAHQLASTHRTHKMLDVGRTLLLFLEFALLIYDRVSRITPGGLDSQVSHKHKDYKVNHRAAPHGPGDASQRHHVHSVVRYEVE